MEYKDLSDINLLILGALDGSASADETGKLEDWISESEKNLLYYRQFKNAWDSGVSLNVPTDKALAKVLDKISERSRFQMMMLYFQRAAAIIILPLLISLLIISAHRKPVAVSPHITYNNVSAAFGSYSFMELPDGSRVWLNAGSNLRYPDRFQAGDRLVYLSGEAYFEVHSDRSSPFIVNTPYFSVKATGTRFNVMAYKNSPRPSVTLIEGKVDVKQEAGRKEKTLKALTAGEHMIFDTLSREVNITTEDTYKHIAWKDGSLVFRNDPITEVARRISLQYNVDLLIEGEKIMSYRFRAKFENEPLDEVLRLLKLSSPIDYREIKAEILPDGSFPKRKIIIFSTEK